MLDFRLPAFNLKQEPLLKVLNIAQVVSPYVDYTVHVIAYFILLIE